VDIADSGSPAGQYLTFRMSRQDCAIEASRVRGILPWRELMATEGRTPVAGFASLRGQLFPVIDLARKLGFAHASHGRSPCIIVVETEGSNGQQLAGFVADGVSEVIQVRARDFRRGRIHAGGRPRRVVEVEALLAPETAPA
jgi:purine-binding chemotaxis protein CheW